MWEACGRLALSNPGGLDREEGDERDGSPPASLDHSSRRPRWPLVAESGRILFWLAGPPCHHGHACRACPRDPINPWATHDTPSSDHPSSHPVPLLIVTETRNMYAGRGEAPGTSVKPTVWRTSCDREKKKNGSERAGGCPGASSYRCAALRCVCVAAAACCAKNLRKASRYRSPPCCQVELCWPFSNETNSL